MNYEIDTIILEVPAGATIYTMEPLACRAALDHKCRVLFKHNTDWYEVLPSDLSKQVRKLDSKGTER